MSKCTECKEYDKDKHYCPKWCDVIKSTIEDARADERAKINDELSEVQQILILYDVDTAEKRREIIDLLEQIKAHK